MSLGHVEPPSMRWLDLVCCCLGQTGPISILYKCKKIFIVFGSNLVTFLKVILQKQKWKHFKIHMFVFEFLHTEAVTGQIYSYLLVWICHLPMWVGLRRILVLLRILALYRLQSDAWQLHLSGVSDHGQTLLKTTTVGNVRWNKAELQHTLILQGAQRGAFLSPTLISQMQKN